jgi:methyl-accepting chemotaxis protein
MPLKIRFLLTSLLLVLLIWLILFAFFPWQVAQLITEELVQKGKESAQNLEKISSGALVLGDRNLLTQQAQSFLRTDQILYVVIQDKEGHPLANSGLTANTAAAVEKAMPQAQNSEGDWTLKDHWPATQEVFYHLSRPVYFEQLRVGTILLGVSTRRASAVRGHLQTQISMLGLLFVGIALVAVFFLNRSIAHPIQVLNRQLAGETAGSEPALASSIKELQQLQETLGEARALYQKSIDQLETQSLELTNQLAALQVQNDSLHSRLNVTSRQMESLQQKMKEFKPSGEGPSALPPQVQFAISMTPEMNSVMQQVRDSVKLLEKDFDNLIRLIDLWQTTAVASSEDLEAIRHYREFIDYDQIRQRIFELAQTIESGAAWSEQLTDLLTQLSQDKGASTGEESPPTPPNWLLD